MKRLLIYPAFADPTQAYVALPTLKGYLNSQGEDATIADLNIEGIHYLSKGKIKKAFKDDFYDFNIYKKTCLKVEKILKKLSADLSPYLFGFNMALHARSPWNFDLLKRYYQRRESPLDLFYRDFFKKQSPDFVGISLTFVSQIPEAFYLCFLIRNLFPKCEIVLGGACLHQIMLSSSPSTKKMILDSVDDVCLGRGEEYFQKKLKLQKLDVPPTPDYSDLDLDLYLAPSRILLYAPTRGCYWNKCSFCYYGLSKTGTSCYSEIPAAKAALQLEELSKKYKTKNFYFSCDVLAPAYALKLAKEIIKRRLKIFWSTDLRIENFYTPEVCKTLYKSGLRSVALGIESGSDRVLKEVINKGTSKKLIQKINGIFHEAGIATQWMAFTYHPGETVMEAHETLDLIENERKKIDLFIVGEFGLTNGSQVFKNPKKFGIKKIYYIKGDEFKLYPQYATSDAPYSVDDRIANIASQYRLSSYPWAGAISTHHSFLYFLKYGQRFFARS